MAIDAVNGPKHLKKNKQMISDRIYHSMLSCERPDDPEIALSELYIHNFLEIGTVVSGSGVHKIMDQNISCKEGDIYIIPANIPHGYFLSDDSGFMTVRRLWLDVGDWFDGEVAMPNSPRFCHGIFKDSPTSAYAMMNLRTQEEIDSLYTSIENEIAEKEDEWQDAVRAYLTELFITVGRYINCSIKNSIQSDNSKEWNTVLSVMRIVEEHFGEYDLTLESIADTLFISKSHLSRIFKVFTGELFSEYLRNVRFNKACQFLKDTNMTIEEIVAKCGLRDLSSFYHNFGVRMNMTPKVYRQKMNLSVETEKYKKTKGEKLMIILSEISENLQKGKAKIVKEMVQQALDEGASPEDILNEGLLSGMNIIGEKFKNNEIYVPEVLVAARAMNMGTQILKPHLAQAGVKTAGRVCIGTVQGDLHDIGKNLVRMMMEGKGLEVVDLGTDVSPETFVKTAIEQNCQVICCSALLTTTMGVMADVVKAAEAAGVRDKVKIMVGGAPVTEEFCKQIGADCYTVDAASAADAAVAFCNS